MSMSLRFTLSGCSHLVSSFECNCFGSFFLPYTYIHSIIRIVLYFVTCFFPCLLRDRAPSARLFLLGSFFGPFDGPLFVSFLPLFVRAHFFTVRLEKRLRFPRGRGSRAAYNNRRYTGRDTELVDSQPVQRIRDFGRQTGGILSVIIIITPPRLPQS